MLRSMTGFGEAHCQQDGSAVAVEVRTINSRYFKLSVRSPEGCAALEPRIEALVRKQVRRGTIQVMLRLDRARSPDDYKINVEVLEGYRRQLEAMHGRWNLPEPVPLESLLLLPGVADENSAVPIDAGAHWPLISDTLAAAMENLGRMRVEEGRAMAADLKANGQVAAASLDRIECRIPQVAAAYRTRLEERLKKILSDFDVELDRADLMREVSLFAERSDISEEIVRLRSHLEQFEATMALPESSGRKLEFLTQEMFREVNTIGSKANDVEISREVIEIKAAIERIREMIQNVE